MFPDSSSKAEVKLGNLGFGFFSLVSFVFLLNMFGSR